jgi:hypothetical protein
MLQIELKAASKRKACVCSCCGNRHRVWVEGEVLYKLELPYTLKVMSSKVSLPFYKALWEPNGNVKRTAGGLLRSLKQGLVILKTNFNYFHDLEEPNSEYGCIHLIEIVTGYIAACDKFKEAKIKLYELSKPEM